MLNSYRYVQSLPELSRRYDHVVKKANARDFIMSLPSPDNVPRDYNLLPDIDMTLILSTTRNLPDRVREKIKGTPDEEIFGHNTLMGLCMSGRRVPIEIFLHSVSMNRTDPSGKLFEEVAWHEMVHAVEGITRDDNGNVVREQPWSYSLQRQMIELDRINPEASTLDSYEGRTRRYASYLRQGTKLQENVSEIFARVGSIYLEHIRQTKTAPDAAAIFSLFEQTKIGDLTEQNYPEETIARNLTDLFVGLATYCEPARDLFYEELPQMMDRISVLYGCRPPSMQA
ncbi:MAG: hypothetical protein DI551_06500 [Micavibrio aeruginosavorus]|uniref:Uncharacterized protein n=1 Tax=Micavibrio aeruginosavorus TaxID=349221 RepID=A0A2W5MYE6_9BACT|nr:MAG: hypothetical protein DI551_06500 [Micavibrio aeruginosavorus]